MKKKKKIVFFSSITAKLNTFYFFLHISGIDVLLELQNLLFVSIKKALLKLFVYQDGETKVLPQPRRLYSSRFDVNIWKRKL